MFINPREAIEQGWILFPDWMTNNQREKCIQPNAIDITLDKLFTVSDLEYACITEDNAEKKMKKCIPFSTDASGFWRLGRNILYDGMSDFYVNVPEKVACDLKIRSSFNRVGLQLNNGIYDSCFHGNVGFTLYNRSSTIKTKPGTRIAQIIFIESNSSGKYEGQYNCERNTHWQSDT